MAEDTALLDWLEEQIVDAIYLDDGRVIDVRGNSVRAAIQRARTQSRELAWTPELVAAYNDLTPEQIREMRQNNGPV